MISTRAVIGDWQPIGCCEPFYPRAHAAFVPDGVIAIPGLIIATLVGVWRSHRFFVVDKTLGTVVFHVSVVDIALILAGAYLATVVMTFLPARTASRVAPAETLRYE